MIFKHIIQILFSLSVLIMVNSVSVMAETESTYPYADIEALKKESDKTSGSNKKLVTQNNTKSLASGSTSKRSIKMIVGGKSEDGVAKQVILPVNE